MHVIPAAVDINIKEKQAFSLNIRMQEQGIADNILRENMYRHLLSCNWLLYAI